MATPPIYQPGGLGGVDSTTKYLEMCAIDRSAQYIL